METILIFNGRLFLPVTKALRVLALEVEDLREHCHFQEGEHQRPSIFPSFKLHLAIGWFYPYSV